MQIVASNPTHDIKEHDRILRRVRSESARVAEPARPPASHRPHQDRDLGMERDSTRAATHTPGRLSSQVVENLFSRQDDG